MPILHHYSPGRRLCIIVMICCALALYCIFYYVPIRVPAMISIRQMFHQRVLYVKQSDTPVIQIADKEEDTFDANCTCSYDGHMYDLCFRTNEGPRPFTFGSTFMTLCVFRLDGQTVQLFAYRILA